MPIHGRKPSIQIRDLVLMKRFPYLARENLEIDIFKKLKSHILLLRNFKADTHIPRVLNQAQPLLRFRLNGHYMHSLDLGWYLWKSGQSESVVSHHCSQSCFS